MIPILYCKICGNTDIKTRYCLYCGSELEEQKIEEPLKKAVNEKLARPPLLRVMVES